MVTTIILPVVAVITSLLTLAGVIYAFAKWRGGVDKQLSDYHEGNILDRMTRMEGKMDVLYPAFMGQILADRPHLATRGSKFELTPDAKKVAQEVKALIPDINPGSEDIAEQVLIELPHRIGLENLRHIAEKHQMTLGELLAIVSVELGMDL